jgi:hypothetical protein
MLPSWPPEGRRLCGVEGAGGGAGKAVGRRLKRLLWDLALNLEPEGRLPLGLRHARPGDHCVHRSRAGMPAGAHLGAKAQQDKNTVLTL